MSRRRSRADRPPTTFPSRANGQPARRSGQLATSRSSRVTASAIVAALACVAACGSEAPRPTSSALTAPVIPDSEIVVAAAQQAARGTTAGEPRLVALTTMATWCVACKKELPRLAELRDRFSPAELALVAVPVDEDDDEAKLAEYRRDLEPAYQVGVMPREQVQEVEAIVLAQLGSEALPATLLTDQRGRLLRTLDRAPTPREVRALLGDRK